MNNEPKQIKLKKGVETPIQIFERKIKFLSLPELLHVQATIGINHIPIVYAIDGTYNAIDKCHDLLNEQISNHISKLFEQ